tara:strand:- start:260 stop:523 length:264 start_codon:yes stop_codon:yes gene_type:complete
MEAELGTADPAPAPATAPEPEAAATAAQRRAKAQELFLGRRYSQRLLWQGPEPPPEARRLRPLLLRAVWYPAAHAVGLPLAQAAPYK